ncbi:hypothetical protein CDAR_245771 [Caerostris darwini]|uniref:Uncharacterized protein n=1 Tax=Caerostris darwini TaxID=1538125 RepID=A0AAV4RZG1_9ARAC|nr:hypothetical protein CDAR_245771 [Caerostris darwini]
MPPNTIGVSPVQLVYGRLPKQSFVFKRSGSTTKNSLEASHSIVEHIEDLQERFSKSSARDKNFEVEMHLFWIPNPHESYGKYGSDL